MIMNLGLIALVGVGILVVAVIFFGVFKLSEE